MQYPINTQQSQSNTPQQTIPQMGNGTASPQKTVSPKKSGPGPLLMLVVGLISGIFGGALVTYVEDGTLNDLVDKLQEKERTIHYEDRIVLEEDSATIDVVQATQNSIVSIAVSKEVQQRVQTPQGQAQEIEVGSGTGFVVSEDGYILTNRHVVQAGPGEATYSIVFSDGTTYEAEVIARDELSDLAILQIEADNLQPIPLGDSDALEVGQTVIAIGNTLGEYEHTVTRGMVSGLSRNLGGQYSGLIQTDAAINQGNSGGPLLNLAGEVIGINTAVDRSGEGLGFAIPINDAKVAVESVETEGRIIRAGLGVRYIQLTPDIASLNNFEYDYGALIRGDQQYLGIVSGGAAEKAGLQEGNIILEVDGVQVNNDNPLASLIKGRTVGETVTVKVYTGDGEKDIEITLQELPSTQ